MRVLFINTSMPPVPFGTGHQVHNWGNIQTLQLLDHEVFLVMLSRYGEDRDEKINQATQFNKNLKLCTCIEVPQQKNRSLNSLSLSLILKELIEPFIGRVPYQIKNHKYVCSELERLIEDTKSDILWYEDFHVAVFDNWINRKIPAVYNCHDNQARLYSQKSLNNEDYSKRIGSQIRWLIYKNRHRALHKSELMTQKRCDIMFTGNSEDARLSQAYDINAISRRVPVIGAEDDLLDKRRKCIFQNGIRKNKVKLIHLGGLHGSFTSESLLWFLSDIWGFLIKNLDDFDIEIHIIGSGKPSEELLKKIDQPKIIYRGFVEDLWEELIDTFAMIIPGQVSTGVRIRVPVAFSMMIPIIGNKVSFHGMLDAKDGETVLYAENAVEYSSAIKKLMYDTSYYRSMCHNVRRVYDDKFSIKAASRDIQSALRSYIR